MRDRLAGRLLVAIKFAPSLGPISADEGSTNIFMVYLAVLIRAFVV